VPKSNRRPEPSGTGRRLSIWYGVLIIILAIFIARLFYLQVIRHDYYRAQALADQLKEYKIEAERGVIKAKSGSGQVPLVLNEKLYTLYADPVFIKNAHDSADKVATVMGAKTDDYEKLMKSRGTRYAVLARRVSEDQKKRITSLKLPGVGTQAQNYRTYPQGSLAAQVLGFVNDDGQGSYGVEQALDETLKGVPGKLKAITDAEGVPLAASRDNIQVDPRPGKDIVLSVTFKNNGNYDMKHAVMIFTVPELAIYQKVGPVNVPADSEISRLLYVEIPKNVADGIYTARVSVGDDYYMRIKHRDFIVRAVC